MNGKERIKKALNHMQTDRVPIDLGGTQTGIMINAYNDLKKLLHSETNENYSDSKILEPMQQLAIVDEKILNYFDIDTRYIFPKPAKKLEIIDHEDGSRTYINDFGNQTLIQKAGCPYFEFKDHPLANAKTKNDIFNFSDWPDPKDPKRYEELQDEINQLKNRPFGIVSVLGGGVMEQSWYLCGLERFMISVLDRPDFVAALLDKVLEMQIELFGNFLDITGKYLDVVEIYDDLAGQNGPIYSPDFTRKVVFPRNKELINFIKSKTDAKVMWHSCGSVYIFIRDLIELGVDVLNPVQVKAANMNDTAKLKREFGKDIVFWGGIDTQNVLPFGKVEDVENEVKLRIDDLYCDGGYVLTSVHNIQDYTPPENIKTMFETAKKYSLGKICNNNDQPYS